MKDDDTIEGEIVSEVRPNRMDSPDGPCCHCGAPSRLESGDCGKHEDFSTDPEIVSEVLKMRRDLDPDAPGAVVLGVPAEAAEIRTDPSTEYEIHVLDTWWQDGYLGVDFEVPGAPNYSYSKRAIVRLEAFVPARIAPSTTPRLPPGPGGSALATVAQIDADTAFPFKADARMTTGAPIMPSEEEIHEACEAKLRNHITSVKRERAHAKADTEATETKGMTFKVKA